MIGPSEITSSTTAIAEPKPTPVRLADAVVRDQRGQQLEAVLAAVDDVDDVERAQGLDLVITTTMTTLIGAITGKTTRKNVWRSLAPSTLAASRSVGSTLFRPAR